MGIIRRSDGIAMSPSWGWGRVVWCGVTIMSPRWGWGGGLFWGVIIMSPRWGW